MIFWTRPVESPLSNLNRFSASKGLVHVGFSQMQGNTKMKLYRQLCIYHKLLPITHGKCLGSYLTTNLYRLANQSIHLQIQRNDHFSITPLQPRGKLSFLSFSVRVGKLMIHCSKECLQILHSSYSKSSISHNCRFNISRFCTFVPNYISWNPYALTCLNWWPPSH